jgi:hypothetical protein
LDLSQAYIAGTSSGVPGVFVVSIADPGNPELLGFAPVDTGNPKQVSVDRGYLYVATGTGGLLIMDVADPEHPTKVARYRDTIGGNSLTGIAVSGDLAFLAYGDQGLRVLDVSSPSAPTPHGYYVAEYYHDVSAVGYRAFVCGAYSLSIIESGGLAVGELGTNALSWSLSAQPNPARGAVRISYSLPEPTRMNLKLYDVTGKMVRTIATGPAKAGVYQNSLDTRFLAKGIYLLRCDVAGRVLSRKLVIQ